MLHNSCSLPVAGHSSCDCKMELQFLLLSELWWHKPLLAFLLKITSISKGFPQLFLRFVLSSFILLFPSWLWEMPCSDPHDSRSAGHGFPRPATAANLCLEWSLQEPTSPNHRPSSRRVGAIIERMHMYLLFRARQRKGQVLSLAHRTLHSASRWTALWTYTLRKWNWQTCRGTGLHLTPWVQLIFSTSSSFPKSSENSKCSLWGSASTQGRVAQLQI